MIESGETASSGRAEGDSQQTLRQKDRFWTKLWKAINLAPKKQFMQMKNLSGIKTEVCRYCGVPSFFVAALQNQKEKRNDSWN